MADWMDSDVDVPDQTLTNAQVFALLRMTEILRDGVIICSVSQIKNAIFCEDSMQVEQLWSELSEAEQTALWVAPKFGGIFTTEERKIIKGANQ